MSPVKERYSHLAPLSVELRTTLARWAAHLFSPTAYKDDCAVIGKEPDPETIRPLGAYDFAEYLKKKGVLDEPLKYTERIRQLLARMAATGILERTYNFTEGWHILVGPSIG